MADGNIEIGIELDDSGVQSEAKRAGQQAGEAFAKGVTSGADSASNALSDVGDAARDTAGQVSSAGQDAGEGLGNGIQNGAENASQSVSDVGDAARDAASQISDAGQNGGEGFGSGISNGADQARNSFGGLGESGISNLGGIAKAALGAVATLETLNKAAQLVGASLNAYADYEQLVGGVDTLFKDASQQLQNYAAQAYQTAGLSANKYMEQATSFSASLIQSFSGDTRKAAEAANTAMIDMSDNANKMGTDIERIQDAYQGFAKQNFTMLDNLKLGYGGTKTEMERLLKDAENIKKANGEMASYSIDSFGDMVEAIHVVQENMGIAGTTSLEAATTIQGSMGMMRAAWENLLVAFADPEADLTGTIETLVESVLTVGENVVPRLTEIINSMSLVVLNTMPQLVQTFVESGQGMMTEFIAAIIGNLPSLIAGFAQVFAELAIAVVEMIPGLIAAISEYLPEAVPTLIEAAVAIVLAIVAALPTIIEALIAALPTIIDSIVTALVNGIDALVLGFVQLFMAFVQALPQILEMLIQLMPTIIQSIVDALINNMPLLLQTGLEFFVQLVKALAQVAPQVVMAIIQLLGQVIQNVIAWVGNMGANARQGGSQFLQGVVNFITQLPGRIWSFLTNTISRAGEFVGSFAGKAIQAGQQFLSNIVDEVGKIPGRMLDIGKNIVEGIWNGISGAGGWLLDQIGGFAGGVIDGIAGFFGIHSPSTIMRDLVGKNLARGIWVGFEQEDVMAQIEHSLTADMASLQAIMGSQTSNYTTNNQTLNFNQPVSSPDEIARELRLQQRYGLAGSY